jgi:GT2 family glycosyltransferase
MVDVSIIVPIRNAERTLPKCLLSLSKLDHNSFEVILVNNLSTDKSKKEAVDFAAKFGGKFRIVVLDEMRPGASAARNRGAAEALGKFFAFTDADCVVEPSWLTLAMAGFDLPAVGAVAGNIRGHRACNVVDAFHSVFTLQAMAEAALFDQFDILTGGFPTANFIVRRAVFETTGGFDEDFQISGEDYDFCARIYLSGYKIKFAPSATVQHLHRHNLTGTWRQGFGFGKSHARLWKRYRDDLFISLIGNRCLKSKALPLRGWIDLGTADKKLFYLIIFAVFYWPAAVALPLYLFYLAVNIAERCRSKQLVVSDPGLLAMAGLLILKSMSMTAGRLTGSIKHGVICF